MPKVRPAARIHCCRSTATGPQKPVFSNEQYLVELLVEAGAVSSQDVDDARLSQDGNETVIERLLSVERITEEDVAKVLAANAGTDYIDLDRTSIHPNVFDTVPEDVARRYRVIPVADDGLYLTVAVADPLDFEAQTAADREERLLELGSLCQHGLAFDGADVVEVDVNRQPRDIEDEQVEGRTAFQHQSTLEERVTAERVERLE